MENEKLEQWGRGYSRFQVENALGPVTLAPKNLTEETKKSVAEITARYSQGRDKPSLVIRYSENGKEELLEVEPATDSDLTRWRID